MPGVSSLIFCLEQGGKSPWPGRQGHSCQWAVFFLYCQPRPLCIAGPLTCPLAILEAKEYSCLSLHVYFYLAIL